MSPGIRCMLMRGGTSKGAYFLAGDLPAKRAERDDLLLRIMGSPDARQIDGIGGAHPLTSKVAIVGPSSSGDADVEFLFAQVNVTEATVDTTPNCGNILAGVAPFAIERGLVASTIPETRVRVKTLNTGTRAELTVATPNGRVEYEGDAVIDGVPGSAAPIAVNFLDSAGSVCGALFPTGMRLDVIRGAEVTCIDNGMPMVLLRAIDFGFSGGESCEEIESASDVLASIEELRLEVARRMGLGDVREAGFPKMCLLSRPVAAGCVRTRTLIPHRCHTSIGVFAAVTVATACVLPGTVAREFAVVPEGRNKIISVEHPTGAFEVQLEVSGIPEMPVIESGGLMRTARALFDGVVFPRAPILHRRG